MEFRRIFTIPAIVFALTLLTVGSSRVAAQTTGPSHVNELLRDAEHFSNQAATDSEELETYTRTKAGWETHAQQLERIRENVNHLGIVVQQLNDARSEGLPWQQEAIDRINPLMHEMAMQLTVTIEHLTAHQSQVHMKPYQDLTRATYEVNTRGARVISDLVEYGEAKSKADSLEQKMEIPPSGESK